MDSEEKRTIQSATFPKGFEALLLEIFDETEVAELKLKVGKFEMHVKRNVGSSKVPSSVVSPIIPPPILSDPMDKSVASAPPSATPPKPCSEKLAPFTNVTFGKSSRLAALEASGASRLISKGKNNKRKEATYKEGDVIKEGQIIGWLDPFGTELPVKSYVSGEVLKLLINNGEAVGYGDPLIAVLPSFHGIK